MKTATILFTICIIGTATVATSASPEDGYIAARDTYIAKLKRRADPAAEKRALSDLERQLRGIIGDVHVKGFPGAGQINLETLVEDMGFGMLDGLVVKREPNQDAIIVTTTGLLQRWIKAHKAWWEKGINVPPAIEAALRSEAFYTQAISTDAAVNRLADLPLAKPAGADFAIAMLVGRSQDRSPEAPDELFVAVQKDQKILIATVKSKITPAPIAACNQIRADFDKRAAALLATYNATGNKNEKLFNDYTKLSDDGEGAFKRCYAQKAPTLAFYEGAKAEAHVLAATLAGP